MKQALEDLIEAVETAINAGDWKVDGACDPTLVLMRAKEALAQPDQYAKGYADAMNWKVQNHLEHLPTAQPEQEPVAWMHNSIRGNVIAHRPADIDRNPDRWIALYKIPPPCPTCEALSRTVMLDQTSHDTTPPQRKPLTLHELSKIFASIPSIPFDGEWQLELSRAIEAAHNIKE